MKTETIVEETIEEDRVTIIIRVTETMIINKEIIRIEKETMKTEREILTIVEERKILKRSRATIVIIDEVVLRDFFCKYVSKSKKS